jgi:hypothetical protein
MSSSTYKESIHLYDAAPQVKPDTNMTGCKMITFTSPNLWEESIRKVSSHKYLYVDLWTFDELKRARSLVVYKEHRIIPFYLNEIFRFFYCKYHETSCGYSFRCIRVMLDNAEVK